MVNFASRLKKRRWPSGLLGLFLSFNLLLVLLTFVHPVADADAYDPCSGNYPCYTTTACSRAEGTLHRCENACPGPNQGYCFANPKEDELVNLSVSIGPLERTLDLGEYIQALYRYGVGAAAVLAAVMIMIGGLQWLTSRGAGQADKAKKRITDATIGLFITVFAWFILNTINPALVMLQLPRIPMTKGQEFVQCNLFKMQVACGHKFALAEDERVAEDAVVTERFNIVPIDDPNALTECVGASCAKAGSSDDGNTCQVSGGTAGEQPSGAPGVQIPQPIGPYECRACISIDQTCEGSKGPNDSCCSGYCGIQIDSGSRYDAASQLGDVAVQLANFPGVCRTGQDGEFCFIDNECSNGTCVLSADWRRGGTCSAGRTGARCDTNGDCEGEQVCTNNMCYPKAAGGFCDSNDNCPDGFECNLNYCTREGEDSEACEDNAQCVERYGEGYACIDFPGTGASIYGKRCTNGQAGSICGNDEDCRLNGNRGSCNIDSGRILNLGPSSSASRSSAQQYVRLGVCTPMEPGASCNPRTHRAACNNNQIWCVNIQGNENVGTYIYSGNAGEPCAPGVCGSRGTCNHGLKCSINSRLCVVAENDNDND